MKFVRIDPNQAKQDPSRSGYFAGEVNVQNLVGLAESAEIELLAVFFSPGGRTIPHAHARDQVLHIVEGQGIVAIEGERRIVSPGDVVLIPAGAWHWHGATRDSAMCHISIKQPGPTNWEVEPRDWASAYDQA